MLMQHGETIHSALPWDIPWWMPDHFVFFGVLYLVLIVLGIGTTLVVGKALKDLKSEEAGGSTHH